MKDVVGFILTAAAFAGAWKFFPEHIIASSYGDCILAAVVFCSAAFLMGLVVVVSSFFLLKLTKVVVTSKRLIAYMICMIFIIIMGFACIPVSLWVVTKFVNYQIVGTAAYIIMWFVLGMFTINSSYNLEKKTNSKCYY